MTTEMFLDLLTQHPEAALVFEVSETKHVKPGYHVTEIMSLTYDTVDCGGVVNHWRETVVQLRGPSQKDAPEFMTAGKFLSIYARVAPKVPIQQDAALRVEYGDTEQPAIHYHIGSIHKQGEQLHVTLTPPGVTCKANDRLAAAERNVMGGCCAPSEAVSTAQPRTVTNPQGETGQHCC